MRIAGILLLVLLIIQPVAGEQSFDRDQFIQFIPRSTIYLLGAHLEMLRDNAVYLTMDQRGKVWSYESGSEVPEFLQALMLDPRKDVAAFSFARYINPYGNSGKLHLVAVTKDVSQKLKEFPSTPYLGFELYRVSMEKEMYAVPVGHGVLALGTLNEVKAAVDVGAGKLAAMEKNGILFSLYRKVPAQAAIWGLSTPLTRKRAAEVDAKQSTNALLGTFQNYYFYGVPTRTSARSHFYGQTVDENDAAVASSIMIGTLLFTKFKADGSLAEALDQVDVQKNGNTVHVTANITKEMVDAYYEGKLGF